MLVRGEEFVREMRGVEDMYRAAQPRAHARGVGEAAAALDRARQPRAAHVARCSSDASCDGALGRLAPWWRKWRFRSTCGCASVAPRCRWSPTASVPTVLHIKGDAVDPSLRPLQTGTDVDILVRPLMSSRLDRAIRRDGLAALQHVRRTDRRSGTRRPTCTMTWGYLDLHRAFPGIRLQTLRPPSTCSTATAASFDEVGVACRVPGVDAQATAAAAERRACGRAGQRGRRVDLGSRIADDRERLLESWPTSSAARVALAAATGDLERVSGRPRVRPLEGDLRGRVAKRRVVGPHSRGIVRARGARPHRAGTTCQHRAAAHDLGREPTRAEVFGEFFAPAAAGDG